ncbi:hypothetical protein BH09PAT2_BH09PAT2_00670 [soil metagenome]
MYSDLYLRPHYQPSKLLVAAAIIAVVSFGIFYYTSDATPTRASKKIIKAQQIVNVTPRQVGIYWESDIADSGWILYGDSAKTITTIASDVFTEKGEAPKRNYHYAVLTNLEPDSTYFYTFISDNEMIQSAEKKPFTVRSASTVGSSGSLSPAYGKVAKSNGEVAKNAIVMLTIPEAYPLMAISGNTGEWLVPLQYFVSRTKNTYILTAESTIAQITFSDQVQKSKVNTVLGQTHPLPQTIVLGENYTFGTSSQVLSAQSEVLRKPAEQNKSYSFAIRYPRNGSVIPGTAPLIKGYGIPDRTVSISINSNPAFTVTTVVDKDGQWSIPVARTFLPGKYTISVISQNANNRQIEIKNTYTLIKSGEQVLGVNDATPSATINPSPTTIRTPTPSVTLAPTSAFTTPTPSTIPSPTVYTTLTPDGISITPTPEPPVSGVSNMVPYVMSGVGLMVVGGGLLLLF